MMTPLIIGLCAGGGLVLVARGLAPRPAPLAATLQRLERVGVSIAETTAGARSSSPRSGRVVSRVAGLALGDIEADLAVLDRSRERHAIEKLTTAAAFLALPLLFALVLIAGGVQPPMGLVLAAVVLGCPLGLVLPDLTIRSQARARRDAFRHALSSYLDLVNVLLAGGAGVETALEAAAEAGDGWSFEAIRAALTRSRTLRTSPWECFADLGQRIGVDELGELAASVQLAGQQGARIRSSLVAKAASLRSHQMARIEADAQSATERMGLPTVLMFVGFLVLLGYPAVQMIVAGFEV